MQSNPFACGMNCEHGIVTFIAQITYSARIYKHHLAASCTCPMMAFGGRALREQRIHQAARSPPPTIPLFFLPESGHSPGDAVAGCAPHRKTHPSTEAEPS